MWRHRLSHKLEPDIDYYVCVCVCVCVCVRACLRACHIDILNDNGRLYNRLLVTALTEVRIRFPSRKYSPNFILASRSRHNVETIVDH